MLCSTVNSGAVCLRLHVRSARQKRRGDRMYVNKNSVIALVILYLHFFGEPAVMTVRSTTALRVSRT